MKREGEREGERERREGGREGEGGRGSGRLSLSILSCSVWPCHLQYCYSKVDTIISILCPCFGTCTTCCTS